jgi:hypothetical protein
MVRNRLLRRLHTGWWIARQITLFAVLAGLFTAGSAQGALTLIPPGLNPGDQFRLTFVSSIARNATSANIADYYTFITGLAVAAGIDDYFGAPITWQAIGSTPTVSAISRLPATSPAIYRIDGALVATSGADLWDGSIANAINLTESGGAIPGGSTTASRVWTGTTSNGAGHPSFSLGSAVGSQSLFGNANETDSNWVLLSTAARTQELRVYGYSSVLTVPAATLSPVPEPSTLVIMAGLGVLGLAGRRLRRRS